MNIHIMDQLSVREQYQLVKIAAECSNYEVKEMALRLLRAHYQPPIRADR